MKALKCASALLLFGLAGEVQAASYAWCQVHGANYESYLSGIVEIEGGQAAFRAFLVGPFGKRFHEYVRTSLDPRASNLNCTREESLFYANDHIDVLINANPGIKFVKTGWSVSRDATRDDPPKRRQEASRTPDRKGVEARRADNAPAKKPWEINYESKVAIYEEELAKQKQAVADYERGKAETAATKAALRAKAEKAQAEWSAAVAACRAGNHAACAGAGQ